VLRLPNLACRIACAALLVTSPAGAQDVELESLPEEQQADAEPPSDESQERFGGIEVMTVVGQAPDRTKETWVDIRVEKQPMGDGAEVLRRLPGFSMIRQGGIGSAPVFRGLGGSRLGVVIDGVPYAGACNHGMDPATTYVNPGEFSELVVLHGPQSVRQAAAISGAVEFKRTPVEFEEPGAEIYGSGLIGSFGQHEFSGDAAVGFEHGYVRGSGGYAESDDYLDGDGNPVFTRYSRWNGRAALGWTPGENTVLEGSAELSDGVMANPTIHMDATKLDRKAYGLRFEKSEMGSWLDGVELRFSYVDVDHEMDDYTLRPRRTAPEDSTAVFVRYDLLGMAQTWQEYFGRGAMYFSALEDDLEIEVGLDARSSDYHARAAFGSESFLRVPPATEYSQLELVLPDLEGEPWNPIVRFTNLGAYTELRWTPRDGSRVVGGFRYDRYRTQTGTMHAAGEITNEVLPGSNEDRSSNLWAGFLRYEHRFRKLPLLGAVGVGHAQRGADYWEVYSYASYILDDEGNPVAVGGIYLDPEKNTELDISAYYGGEKVTGDVSFFLSQVDDFILTYNGIASYNVQARRVGAEMALAYRILDELVASAELSFVFAENVTQAVPLAQTPPLEGTLRLRYESELFALGFASRFVDRQDRIHPNHGNRIGVDTTETPGFAVLSADASFTPWSWLDVSFGVDNLLDHTYHEHLSRNTSPVPGFVSREKINEPGRRFWLRLSVDYDI
jgi:iron complex outermembrane receptor protein